MNDTAPWSARAALAVRQTLPARLRASGIHLAISATIFAATLYLILVHWFPGFHFGVDGGWQGVRIMAAVDLVLGPALTLLVFNPLKARKLIAFDLACIGVIQLGALAWGFYAIHSQRPVAVSFHEGSFWSVTAAPLAIEKYDVAQLALLSDRHPALVFVAEPANDEEMTRAGMQELMGGVAMHEDPFFFRRFADHWAEVRAKGVDAAARSKDSPAFAAELPDFLAGRGAQAGDFVYFPYEGRYGHCTVAFTPAGDLAGAIGCESF
jgi:hypothetical protein